MQLMINKLINKIGWLCSYPVKMPANDFFYQMGASKKETGHHGKYTIALHRHFFLSFSNRTR